MPSFEFVERVHERRRPDRAQYTAERAGQPDLREERHAPTRVAGKQGPVAEDEPPALTARLLGYGREQTARFLVSEREQRQRFVPVDRGDDPRRPPAELSATRIEQDWAREARRRDTRIWAIRHRASLRRRPGAHSCTQGCCTAPWRSVVGLSQPGDVDFPSASSLSSLIATRRPAPRRTREKPEDGAQRNQVRQLLIDPVTEKENPVVRAIATMRLSPQARECGRHHPVTGEEDEREAEPRPRHDIAREAPTAPKVSSATLRA